MAEPPSRRVLHLFSREKLNEFREMALEVRLRWLEEADALVNAVRGPERRAETDERFADLPHPKHSPIPSA